MRLTAKPLSVITDGSRKTGLPGKPAKARMQLPQARHSAGHAGSASTDQTRVRHDLAGRIHVHVRGSTAGSALAVVEEVSLAIDEQRSEPAAAEVAGLRIGHREGEGDRD